jgi:hypothetical protein
LGNTLANNRNVVVAAINETLAFYGKEDWETTKRSHRDPDKSLEEILLTFLESLKRKPIVFIHW